MATKCVPLLLWTSVRPLSKAEKDLTMYTCEHFPGSGKPGSIPLPTPVPQRHSLDVGSLADLKTNVNEQKEQRIHFSDLSTNSHALGGITNPETFLSLRIQSIVMHCFV